MTTQNEMQAKLSELVSGSTIRSVIPCNGPEGAQFTLRLEKDGRRFDVQIFGTDLGWWFKAIGNTK